MSIQELNPNHPVTREMHEQWHKILAITLFKLGRPEIVITSSDIEEFSKALGPDAAVAVHPRGDVMRVFLVNGAEAARLARKEGGLPT